MNVIVDNHPEPNPVKYMWVQVVWQDIPGLPHTGPELSGFNPLASTPLTAVGPVDLGFGWFETTYKWEIRPNPRDEFFILGGNINVDQLLIDTWCIPEPGTGLLTVLGGGLLLGSGGAASVDRRQPIGPLADAGITHEPVSRFVLWGHGSAFCHWVRITLPGGKSYTMTPVLLLKELVRFLCRVVVLPVVAGAALPSPEAVVIP
jgi:hypothetical protein